MATFQDVPEFNADGSPNPYYPFIEQLHALGLTSGESSGHYGPDDPLTRGQAAVFIVGAINKIVDALKTLHS